MAVNPSVLTGRSKRLTRSFFCRSARISISTGSGSELPLAIGCELVWLAKPSSRVSSGWSSPWMSLYDGGSRRSTRSVGASQLQTTLLTCQQITSHAGSPYSTAERRVPELIPVLGSQPEGDVSHEPGGRLSLHSARPAVTLSTLKRASTSFAAWWTEARWVRTVCLRLLPDSVAAAIWPRALCAWVQHANHSATEPPRHVNVNSITN